MTIMSVIPTSVAASGSRSSVRRGRYNEIASLGGISAKDIVDRFQTCLPERFISFDRKMRGDALNLDLYGYCESEDVALIQIRHTFRRGARHYANTHKDYVLCGFNEITKEPFRHPVSCMRFVPPLRGVQTIRSRRCERDSAGCGR